ncbi:MAG: erfK/YbiS/YcfS/YnhG protein [Osedax symbiont Rs1]|nr:MAG: erfK/YbiS/YcfS/YnhG protein [Osedax symbiont Rs1]
MRILSLVFLSLFCVQSQLQAAVQDYGVSKGNEELLLQGFESIAEQNFDVALKQIKKLVTIRPDFRLAQLVYADLLISQVNPLSKIGSSFTDSEQKKIQGLIEEAKARIRLRKLKPAPDLIPKDIVMLSDKQKYVIVQDMSMSRLFIFENRDGVPFLIKDFYASHGQGGTDKRKQGDKKSPVGVYFTTGRLLDENLPQRYGAGALPLNYPNAWDYRNKRTGNGIWLHGSPVDTYSRPPMASLGCLSLTNPDFQEVDLLVSQGTPMILGENLTWLSRADWKLQKAEMVALVKSWEADWESLDYRRYISHYSKKFSDGNKRYQAFSEHKKRVNSSKSFIDIDLNDLNIFTYPDTDLMVVSFDQSYKSSNYNGSGPKRQYWQKENNTWKIAYEGAPSIGIP